MIVSYEKYEEEMNKLLKSKEFEKLNWAEKLNAMLDLASKYKLKD